MHTLVGLASLLSTTSALVLSPAQPLAASTVRAAIGRAQHPCMMGAYVEPAPPDGFVWADFDAAPEKPKEKKAAAPPAEAAETGKKGGKKGGKGGKAGGSVSHAGATGTRLQPPSNFPFWKPELMPAQQPVAHRTAPSLVPHRAAPELSLIHI